MSELYGLKNSWLLLPALFGDTRFDRGQSLFFAQQGRQLVTLAIMSLCHISPFRSLCDDGVLHRYILLFRLNVVGRKCYT